MGPSDLEEQNQLVAEVVVHRKSSGLVSKAENVAFTCERLAHLDDGTSHEKVRIEN